MQFRAMIKDACWTIHDALSEEDAAVKACRQYQRYGNYLDETITITPVDGLGNLETPVVFQTSELSLG